MNSNIFKVDNLLKVIPGVIIFYGFIYADDYYGYFHIGIRSIYTFEEIILGFLPIIRPLFILTFIVLIIPLMMYLIPKYFDMKYHFNQIEVSWDDAYEIRNAKSVLAFIFSCIKPPVIVFYLVGKILSAYRDNSNLDPFFDLFLGYTINIIFILSAYQALILVKHLYFKRKPIPLTTFFLIITFFIGAKFFSELGIVAAQNMKYDSIVSFSYEGECIITGQELISLGDTKKYIVLRDTTTSTNYFYERDKITQLTIKKRKVNLK
ncbi:hypothetical protein [Reichenbachiella sp.]|uniref:hypothetical protein n=1 Tax=Reichenbachiella sp. TaxID=2184521 RepID=UPI003B5A6FB2